MIIFKLLISLGNGYIIIMYNNYNLFTSKYLYFIIGTESLLLLVLFSIAFHLESNYFTAKLQIGFFFLKFECLNGSIVQKLII